jgi:pilus assembly protein Flp/PilA
MLGKTPFASLRFSPTNIQSYILPDRLTGNPNERRIAHMLFAPKEKGQGLVEYALILVLVAIVVIAALMVLGPIIGNVFSQINSSLSSF